MTKTLQELFIESRGTSVRVGPHLVWLADRLPLPQGVIRLHFLSPVGSGQCETQGVLLDAGKKGAVFLRDGTKAERLKVWHEEGLPPTAEYEVRCPSGQLLIYNIYRYRFKGNTFEEHGTGNAGMVILQSAANRRRYGCSDNEGDFDPTDLEFEVEWEMLGA